MHVFDFSCGNYKYLRGGFQYSGGVSSLPGYIIKHVRFAAPLPLQAGFERVRQFLIDAGQPLTSLCACELRSPEPFSEQGFVAFNRHYVSTLSEWGIFDGTTNPVARTNVCPVVSPPREPSLYAFSFTLPHTDQEQSFVISGSGEASDGPGSYPERTIRCGETTPDGIGEKARFVLSRLKRKWERSDSGGITSLLQTSTPFMTFIHFLPRKLSAAEQLQQDSRGIMTVRR